ncbi:S49 family peptidase [Crenobacter cavernae]|uniref:S49 family peptidase n=1 Tax=Crenobacter cavernae TaxID=2290923 RepID=A0ABY0FA15_9NEIS|nr:S49 family peptidase [Crenobacter cavernae]RXZ42503.1 S49 family peptidase [Crenobacter cavernae]
MNQDPNWERQLVERLASAALVEQRRTRQWKIFFRLVWLALAALVVAAMWSSSDGEKTGVGLGGAHTALVDLDGAIDSDSKTVDKLVEGMEAAYKSGNTRGIVIRANSPGGSPVLSGMAYDEIKRLKKQHPDIPVVVAIEEVCASGCYYIAAAADKIYADKASIVGSIGVLSSSFGFTGTLEKLGVERRLMTAGANKAMGDPFSPENPQHEAIRRELIDDIHKQFIAAVKVGRGSRLKSDPDLFSGRVWLGDKSMPLGLIDGIGSARSVARDVIKAENIVDYTPQDDLTSRFARRFGVSVSDGVRGLFSSRLL